MKIDSYNCMKTTFDYFCNMNLKLCVNSPMYVIVYDEYHYNIAAGVIDSSLDGSMIYVRVDYDEALHFNKKMYEEKIDELKLLIKKDKVNKKLQDLESDFI